MNRNRISIITTFLLSLTFISLWAQEAEFRIATYNIRQMNQPDIDQGDGWDARYPVIVQLIRYHDFDIFGTQEGFKNQLEDLKENLPGFDYIGHGRDDGKDGGEHSAIFYKTDLFELIDNGDFWLSETPDQPGLGWDAACVRICSWGKFRHIPSGKIFQYFNLHLDHVGIEARRESCKLILQKINELGEDIPIFLSGDFNVDQHNEIYNILASSDLVDSFDEADFVYALNGTFNGFQTQGYTDSRIDHIFVTKDIDVLKYGILTDTYRKKTETPVPMATSEAPVEIEISEYKAHTPSDHFPVVIKVTL